MPKVSLTTENKVQQSSEFPKLSLEHGEKALIVCIEPEPTVEYRHTLEAPEIGPDGKVLKEEAKTQKGETYEKIVKEYVGTHLCLGDFGTLQDRGVDPEGCPTCRAAAEEEGILPPKPHYAMHVIKYSTQPNSWNVRDPFNVELVAWVFSPTRFNAIIDLAAEWGNLQEHDLKLGPCENKKFQKYDINVSKGAAWLSGADDKEIAARKQVVAQTYKNNQCPDLSTLIGRKLSKGEIMNDIQKVIERYNQVNDRSKSVSVPDMSAVQQPSATTSAAVDGMDVFKSTTDDAGNAVDTTTGEVTEKSEPSNLKQMDFSDILADL